MKKFQSYYNSVIESDLHKEFYDKYPLNHFWSCTNIRDMKDFIFKAETLRELVHLADSTFMFSVNENSKSNELSIHWLLDTYKRHYGYDIFNEPSTICESDLSLPDNNISINGLTLSPDFLRCYFYSKRIEELLLKGNKVISRVLEVGAGTGHLARVMSLRFDVKQYVIIDIPETLAFSYAFLTENFPSHQTHLYDPATSLKKDIEDAQFVFVAAPYASDFPVHDYDLFLNTASLGEMRSESSRFWMNLVQEVFDVKKLYTVNRYLNSIKVPDHLWRLEENVCSTLYDAKWEMLSWELEPVFTRCPYVDTQIARYVEIVAEHENQAIVPDRLLQIKDSIREQDWYRFRNKDISMTLLDTATQHDFSMTGTLFQLWNMIRLTNHEDPELLESMLIYLQFLMHGRSSVYEEFYYYLAVLEEREPSYLLEKIKTEYCNYDAGVPEVATLSLIQKAKLMLKAFMGINSAYKIQQYSPPTLVHAGIDSNIVHFRGYFYTLKHEIGAINLNKLRELELAKFPRQRSFQI